MAIKIYIEDITQKKFLLTTYSDKLNNLLDTQIHSKQFKYNCLCNFNSLNDCFPELCLFGYKRKINNIEIDLENKKILNILKQGFNAQPLLLEFKCSNKNILIKYIDVINSLINKYKLTLSIKDEIELDEIIQIIDSLLYDNKKQILNIKYNSLMLSYKEFKKIYNQLNFGFNSTQELSQLEKIIFIYDVIKYKIYENNDIHYSKFIEYVLKKMNVDYLIKETTKNHNLLSITIEDEKYNINNCFLFCFSRLNNENKEDYINNYEIFTKYESLFSADSEIITMEQFFECLYNVKTFEYNIGLINKKYSLNEIKAIVINLYSKNDEMFLKNNKKNIKKIILNLQNDKK